MQILSKITRNIKAKDLNAYFSLWIKFLAEYSKLTIYDDPIIKQYREEFFQEFKILDDDADNSSFDLQTQFWLDEYCDTMSLKLGEMETDENEENILGIKNDIKALKENQSSLTKNEVISSLSLIWAKSRKLGLNFLNEIYTKVKSSINGRFKPLILNE